MEKLECWVRDAKKSDALLEHERGHWYMQSVVAKEMEGALADLRADDPTSFSKLAGEKFDWYRIKRSGFVDKQYDDDTNHGTNKPQQGIWDGKIAGWARKEPSTSRVRRDGLRGQSPQAISFLSRSGEELLQKRLIRHVAFVREELELSDHRLG